MTSTCTIYRRDGVTTNDDGLEVPAWEVVYEGICRLGGITRSLAQHSTQSPVDLQVERGHRTLHLPHDVPELQDGDLAEVSGETGGVWRVVEADGQDQATARRLPVVAADRPTEWESV